MLPNPILEVIGGSTAYGVEMATSDNDLIGIVIPPIDHLFPHLYGHVNQFLTPSKNFETIVEHHITFHSKKYDVTVYSLQKILELLTNNNPNILELLWVPEHCIISCDKIGQYLISKRDVFLSKKSYTRLNGFARKQYDEMFNTTKRPELIKEHGFDTKSAYHAIRLANECLDILEGKGLNLTGRASFYTDIRNGTYSLEYLSSLYKDTVASIEESYTKTELQEETDINEVYKILWHCLKMKYPTVEFIKNYEI